MNKEVRIGLIGNGRWGSNYIRTAKKIDSMSVIDVTPVVKENFKLNLTDFFFDRLIADHDLDGFIVATSPH